MPCKPARESSIGVGPGGRVLGIQKQMERQRALGSCGAGPNRAMFTNCPADVARIFTSTVLEPELSFCATDFVGDPNRTRFNSGRSAMMERETSIDTATLRDAGRDEAVPLGTAPAGHLRQELTARANGGA